MIIEEWAPNFKAPIVRFRLVFWEFRKLGVPYFGILIIRILLFRGTVFGSPIFGNSPCKGLSRAFELQSPRV